MGQGHRRRVARALSGVVPKRDLHRAETVTATISVAKPPTTEQRLPDGEYALALVDSVLYLACVDGAPPPGAPPAPGPRHARLRLAEAELAMAFGGPPFHSTLHFEHPAVGRLVVSLEAIEFATLTESTVNQVRVAGAW